MAKITLPQAVVKWSYPREFENAKDTELSYEGFGVYCISRIFGETETILYIGKTAKRFIDRLASHEYSWLSDYRGKKNVRFGTITIPETVDARIINDIESGIIHEIKPIQNSDKKQTYTCETAYVISNTGFPGKLPRIIDMNNH